MVLLRIYRNPDVAAIVIVMLLAIAATRQHRLYLCQHQSGMFIPVINNLKDHETNIGT